MVLASGMPWAWICSGEAFAVKGLPTRYGRLDFSIKADGDHFIEVAIGGAFTLPPGGLSIAPPLPDGRWIQPGVTTVFVKSLPFHGILQLEPRPPDGPILTGPVDPA